MSFIFIAVQYPAPGHKDELIKTMTEMAAFFRGKPGFVEAGPWVDEKTDRVLGISRWESKDAFFATGITVGPTDQVFPGETRPRERFFLEQPKVVSEGLSWAAARADGLPDK